MPLDELITSGQAQTNIQGRRVNSEIVNQGEYSLSDNELRRSIRTGSISKEWSTHQGAGVHLTTFSELGQTQSRVLQIPSLQSHHCVLTLKDGKQPGFMCLTITNFKHCATRLPLPGDA
jgi:hypothetical protein